MITIKVRVLLRIYNELLLDRILKLKIIQLNPKLLKLDYKLNKQNLYYWKLLKIYVYK
jgi:hypothetical protein